MGRRGDELTHLSYFTYQMFPCQLFRESGLCKTIASLNRGPALKSIQQIFVYVYVTILVAVMRSIRGSGRQPTKWVAVQLRGCSQLYIRRMDMA